MKLLRYAPQSGQRKRALIKSIIALLKDEDVVGIEIPNTQYMHKPEWTGDAIITRNSIAGMPYDDEYDEDEEIRRRAFRVTHVDRTEDAVFPIIYDTMFNADEKDDQLIHILKNLWPRETSEEAYVDIPVRRKVNPALISRVKYG